MGWRRWTAEKCKERWSSLLKYRAPSDKVPTYSDEAAQEALIKGLQAGHGAQSNDMASFMAESGYKFTALETGNFVQSALVRRSARRRA